MQKLLYLSIAGALGALARYGLSGAVQKTAGPGFPFGTAVVNIAGCFAAGFLWSLFEDRFAVSPQVRIVVLVGFMGAFTTFSTFIAETSELFRTAQWTFALGNLVLQNAAGLVAFAGGNAIAKWI